MSEATDCNDVFAKKLGDSAKLAAGAGRRAAAGAPDAGRFILYLLLSLCLGTVSHYFGRTLIKMFGIGSVVALFTIDIIFV